MKIEVRKLRADDYEQLIDSMIEAYGSYEDYWKKSTLEKLIRLFPDGQFCVEVNGKVAAAALSIIVLYELYGDEHNYREITGNFSFDTHTEDGDVLYGIDVFVHPEFRGMRLGRRLYQARKELCEKLNLKGIVIGGRLPNYHNYSEEMSPREYISKVRSKEIHDPVLNFQLANNFHVIKVLKNYLEGDQESEEYAALLQWNNIYYSKKRNAMTDSIIRLGLVQWQMRHFKDLDSFYEQVEFFIDALADYKSDFVVFPEFFNTPLLAPYNDLPEHEAMRKLAELTEPIKKKLSEYAISYNVNIIAGSMPTVEDGQIFNTSYLLHRNGKTDSYQKIHITPNEQKYYGFTGGEKIKVFDTDCGKIGLLICYDVEFPELPRLLADQGMKILFVPYLTDTQNAYNRVRACAQARAIENECYVAITGCVGNLPGVSNMDIQFGQAAVFTPSDFSFPENAIKAEATPNTEMTVIADVDLVLLKDLHYNGSVRTLGDRRKDLYEVKLKKSEMEDSADKVFMNRCIKLAKISKQRGESPVGSVIVKDGQIIGEGIESVKARNDISFHSEVEAIRDACQRLGHRDLSGCVLYTTHEPCIMCSYIIRQTKISKVVFGISTGEIGGYSSKLPVLTDQTVERWNQPPEIIAGFMENECRMI